MIKALISAALMTCAASVIAACEFTFGVVPQFEHRRTTMVWAPIIETLEQATGCDIVFRGSRSIPEFEDQFKSGAFDIAYMNPYHAVLAHGAQGYVPIVRSGRRALQGILVVPTQSHFETIHDLNGTAIAFPSPNALGASLLMRAELRGLHGIAFTANYVGTHSSVYINTFKGLTDAGGGVQRTLEAQDPVLQDGLRVLYRTQAVPSHPVVVHPRVAAQHAAVLRTAFFELANEQPDLLQSVPMADPVTATITDYAELDKLGLRDFME